MGDAPDLHLPKIEGKPLPPSLRSMDEIDQWIEETYRDGFDRDAYERRKRRESVSKPFVLR